MSNRFEPRRSWSALDHEHQEPTHAAEHTQYPAEPGPSSPTYPYHDRYGPPRAGPTYRGDTSYTNTYRGDSWRPERDSAYYRPPSPDRSTARVNRPDARPRSVRYDSPPHADRRPSESHQDPAWSRQPREPRDIMAERMFEPSDSWKQAHSSGDHWEPHRDGRVRPPMYANNRWRRSPSPPPSNNWDVNESRSQAYVPPNRSPTERAFRTTGNHWDAPRRASPEYSNSVSASESYSPAPSEHRRDPSALAIPRPPAFDADERLNRQSPTRPQNAQPPNILFRRESYWPEPSGAPPIRSPRDAIYRTNTWGIPSRTPSGSMKREGVVAVKDHIPMREGSVASTGPQSSDQAVPPSRSSTPASLRETPLQKVNQTGLLAKPHLRDDSDSLASTPRDEQQLSRATSPGRSKSPGPPGLTQDFEPKKIHSLVQARDDESKPGSLAVVLEKLSPSHSSLQPLSNTPPPGILPDEPIAAEPETTEVIEVTEVAAVTEGVNPVANDEQIVDSEPVVDNTLPIPDSAETSAPGTPVVDAGPLDLPVRKTRSRITVRAPLAVRAKKAVTAAAITAAAAAAVADSVVTEEAERASAAPQETVRDTLRLFVSMRLRSSHQTRSERVFPVLKANEALARVHKASLRLIEERDGRSSNSSEPAPHDIVREWMDVDHTAARHEANALVRPSLQARFAQRQADLNDKVTRLRAEYLELHERWVAHCAKLDEVAKAGALEEAATNTGRTTRRSAASLGDAVRSDLEMEQIIASLGNEELTDANHLAARNAAVIPDMISIDLHPPGGIEEYLYQYDDTNNLVEDPDSFYAPKTGLHDWTDEEKRMFLEKYLLHPKQFGIIAESLPHKTAAQCVTYYYLAKEQIDFKKLFTKFTSGRRRRGGGRGGGAAGKNRLLTDIYRRDAEVSREHAPGGLTNAGRRGKPASTAVDGATGRKTSAAVNRRGASGPVEHTPGTTPTPTPDPEPEARRKRRRVTTARAAAAQEQDGENEEADEDGKPAKRGRRSKRVKGAADSAVPTSTNTPVIPSEDFPKSSEARPAEAGDPVSRKFLPAVPTWSEEEKNLFVSLIGRHGDDFKRIAAAMPTKTTVQISAFYEANQDELNLEEVVARDARRSPSPDAAGGSGEPSLKRSGSEILSNGASYLSSQSEATGYPAFPSNYGQPPEYRPLSRTRTMPDGMIIGEDMRIHAPVPYYGSPAPMDMHSPYGPPHMHHHHHHHHPPMPPPMTPLMGGPPPHYITNPSPFASPQPPSHPPPSTLTTTFPSNFPYNNLSPSHFAGMPHPGAPPSGAVGMGPGSSYTHPHPPPRVWGPQ